MSHEDIELAVASGDPVGQLGVASGFDGYALRFSELNASDVSEVVAVALGAEKILCTAAQAGQERIVPNRLLDHRGRQLEATRATPWAKCVTFWR